jgi:hypothetical protein
MGGEQLIGGSGLDLNDPQAMQQACNEAMMKYGKARECDTEGCDGKVFLPANQIIELSAIASPNGQALVAQAQVMVCIKCWQLIKPQ